MSTSEPASEREVATSPSATLVVRRPDPGSAVLTLTGDAGRDDAAVLGRWVHREMDRHPTVLVVRLHLDGPTPEPLREVVAEAHARARREGIGLRVVTRDPGGHDLEVPEPS